MLRNIARAAVGCEDTTSVAVRAEIARLFMDFVHMHFDLFPRLIGGLMYDYARPYVEDPTHIVFMPIKGENGASYDAVVGSIQHRRNRNAVVVVTDSNRACWCSDYKPGLGERLTYAYMGLCIRIVESIARVVWSIIVVIVTAHDGPSDFRARFEGNVDAGLEAMYIFRSMSLGTWYYERAAEQCREQIGTCFMNCFIVPRDHH